MGYVYYALNDCIGRLDWRESGTIDEVGKYMQGFGDGFVKSVAECCVRYTVPLRTFQLRLPHTPDE